MVTLDNWSIAVDIWLLIQHKYPPSTVYMNISQIAWHLRANNSGKSKPLQMLHQSWYIVNVCIAI